MSLEITKRNLGWNTSAISSVSCAGDCEATFSVTDDTMGAIVGLASGDRQGYAHITHGIFFETTATWKRYRFVERGQIIGTFNSFTQTDNFKIKREGGGVKFFVNGSLVRTSQVPSKGTVILDSVLYASGDNIL